MAAPASRQDLIDYCLRRLGHPLTEINVDDDQLSDRLDDALQYFQDYSAEGVERLYLKQLVTPTVITMSSSIASYFALGETVRGLSSNATTTLINFNAGDQTSYNVVSSNGTSLVTMGCVGTFVTGETIIGLKSNVSAVVTSFTLGAIDKGYFDIPDGVLGVVRILPFTATNTGLDYMFDIRYQLRLNDLFDLMNTSVIYYQQVKAHLDMIDMLLVGEKSFRYQRHQNKLYIDMLWGVDVKVGEYVLVECYRILDPNQWIDVYNDRFLKRYATAMIKRQWGENLKKFAGIQMPGGVTLNGQIIYDEAVLEIKQLEDDLDRIQEPPNFQVG